MLDEAQALMQASPGARADRQRRLRAARLATVKDIVKNTEHPVANKGRPGPAAGRRRVGAGTEERVEAGCRGRATPSGHRAPVACWKACASARLSKVEVIGGNIATPPRARRRARAARRGSASAPAPSAPPASSRAWACRRSPRSRRWAALEGTGVPLIADGGIRYSGDGSRRRAACMAACSPARKSPRRSRVVPGRSYKSYRRHGQSCHDGSVSADRYSANNADKLVPEGIEGRVPTRAACGHHLHTGRRHPRLDGYQAAPPSTTCAPKTEFVEITSAGVRARSRMCTTQITAPSTTAPTDPHTVNYNKHHAPAESQNQSAVLPVRFYFQ